MKTTTLVPVLIALALVGCGGGGSNEPPRVNQAPTVSKAADLSTPSGTEAITNVTVADDAAAGGITLTASSSDPAVLSDAALAVTGAGANRQISITPDGAVLGTATVTLTARDAEGAIDQSDFVVTVTAREVSFQAYSRLVFDDPESGTPHNVNVLSFDQDADADGFEDLIAR